MSTVPQKVVTQFINEGNSYQYIWSYGNSLVGNTVSWIVQNEDTLATAVVATAAGLAANATGTVTLSYGSLPTGVYDMEIWSNVGSTGELMLYPAENVKQRIVIQERFGT